MAFCGKQLWRLVLAVQVLLAATTTVLAQQDEQGPTTTSSTMRRLRRAPIDIIHIAATPSDESLRAPLVRGLKYDKAGSNSEKSQKSGKSEKSQKSGKHEKSSKKSGKSETTSAHVRAIDFEGFLDLSMSMSMSM